MAPLSDASVAAIVAAFSTTYGRFSVTESSRNKLVEVWRGKGETLAELPLDVDVDDVESWKTEWEAMLDDAGIDAKTERGVMHPIRHHKVDKSCLVAMS